MRKETTLAIFAGISIGLIAAFGIWKATSSIKKNNIDIEATKSPTSSPIVENTFAISNLKDFDVISKSPFTIVGTAKPFSDIVVSTSENDYYQQVDENGSFEIEVDFPVSLSETKIVNFDSDGKSLEIKLKIVYSDEFKKYEDDLKKSKSYVGTVTDISSETIQLKSTNGEILQAEVSEETVYVNLLKKSAIVKDTDLAIGDYIIAMGLINGNKVLATKRVLITNELVDDKRQVVLGKIKEVTTKKLSLLKIDDETLEILLPKKWNGPDVDDLEENQTIIVSIVLIDETYSLRSIFTPVK